MELLHGETLAERLRGGAHAADEALPIVAQMAAALDAAHEVGVVHRDFKCANVMLRAAVRRAAARWSPTSAWRGAPARPRTSAGRRRR